jgi:serine O-acetyltransferase
MDEKVTKQEELPPLATGATNCNPPGIGIWALLMEDLRTHDGDWLEQGFWAIAVHRLANWRMSFWRPLRWPMSLMCRFMHKWVEWTCGITLPSIVKVGRRVRIWHHGGMILHARSIGDDVHIRHNTTFGVARTGENLAIPVIGNGVDIGCGVCVLGNVHLGDGCVVGANAVVLQDVPAGAVAVGIPARIVPRKESGVQLADEVESRERVSPAMTTRRHAHA